MLVKVYCALQLVLSKTIRIGDTQYHLDDNGINLLEVSRPHWLREYDDIGHYNAFGQFLLENLSFSGYVILSGIRKRC